MPSKTPSLDTIFCAAIEIGSAEGRAAFLAEACGGDAELRRRVEKLVAAHFQAGSFLEGPTPGREVTAGFRPPGASSGADGPPTEAGSVIGQYKLLEPIGEGGMGTVYMAEQTHPVRRKVALKVIKPGMDTRQVIARFEAERQALALMDHPNIARVLDAGATESGRPYFVMELVRGIPITDYCDKARLPIPERLNLFVQVCQAVQHAHQKGVIHRDIKPTNVLITLHDGVPVPKVIDFGIAKATGQSLTDKTLYTGFLQLVGTPLYMSPEQAEMSGLDVDTRSDVYSLGVLLYELLTGTTPFDRETFRTAALDEMRRIIREEEPPKPSTRLSSLGETLTTVSANRKADPRHLGRSVRGELDWIVMRAMEKDRRRRYETANDFASDVMRYLTDRPVEACPPSVRYRFIKFARRNRAALTTAMLVGGALLLGLAGSVVMAVRAMDAERRTAAALARARDSLGEADRQRERARKAVDEMYTQVATRWLAREGGLTPLQREFLEKALAFYEEFARERADDPEARAEAAKAAARVGEIRSQLGQTVGALESHGRALEAFRRLAAEFPHRPPYRREVARNLQDLAPLHAALGRTRDAEPAYREALALREELAEAPGTADDRADLAAGLRSLGDFLFQTRRPDEGEKALLRARDLLARLVDESPEGARYRGQLATTEECLGDLYWTEGKVGAEASLRHSLELRRTLADADPADPETQFDLARAYVALGDSRRLRQMHREAVEVILRALPIEERLVVDHPDRPRYRSLLARTLGLLAEQLVDLGQLGEAEPVLRRGREIGEKLAHDFPDMPDYRLHIALGLGRLGLLLAQQGRDHEAREAFERGYELSKKLFADHPDLRRHRQNLASLCYNMAGTYDTLSSRDGRDIARARELARESVAIGPENAAWWSALALAEYRAGDLDAALKAETRALELRSSDGWGYDWLLMSLIHLDRGDREQARWWAWKLLRGKAPGSWSGEVGWLRLARDSEARLRALIPADPEGFRALLERDLEEHRRSRGPADPVTLQRMGALADLLAATGRYDEAAALLEESRRLRPDRFDTWGPLFARWFQLAFLKLREGDVDGYRALCTEMLRRAGGTKQANVAAQLARLCTAIPGAVDDPGWPLELGRRAVAIDGPRVDFLMSRGAAEFRAGRYREAAETLDGSAAKQGPAPARRAQAILFLAMAQHRLGRAGEARRALAEADRLLSEQQSTPERSTPPGQWDWPDLTLCRVLRREAGELLGIAAPPGAGEPWAGPPRRTDPGEGPPGTPRHDEWGGSSGDEAGP